MLSGTSAGLFGRIFDSGRIIRPPDYPAPNMAGLSGLAKIWLSFKWHALWNLAGYLAGYLS